VRQPDMRFVTVKSVDQQAVLAWHCVCGGWSDDRSALINRRRGLLAEFGVWLAQSPEALKRNLPRLLEDEILPSRIRRCTRRALRSRKADRTLRDRDPRTCTAKRGSTAYRGDHRRRSIDRKRCDCHRQQRPGLQERSSNGGVAGPGSEAVQLRWKSLAGEDNQTRGHLSPRATHRRSAFGADFGNEEITGEAHSAAALDD
jgi:hypothetical protein